MNTKIALTALTAALALSLAACPAPPPVSDTGITKAEANIKVGSDGLTAEQRNVKARIEAENTPGTIKHVYVVSAYTGDVILYSTAKGKVSSSGKRLSPYTVYAGSYASTSIDGIPIMIGGAKYRTGEVLQDDGTYGSSAEYLYWWDARGLYHQHYPSGGQIVHVSDSPMAWPKIIMNLETTAAKNPPAAAPPDPTFVKP